MLNNREAQALATHERASEYIANAHGLSDEQALTAFVAQEISETGEEYAVIIDTLALGLAISCESTAK